MKDLHGNTLYPIVTKAYPKEIGYTDGKRVYCCSATPCHFVYYPEGDIITPDTYAGYFDVDTCTLQTPKRYYVNTDTIDIRNKQIGVHSLNSNNREYCIGINHKGTNASVEEATRIANSIADALNSLDLFDAPDTFPKKGSRIAWLNQIIEVFPMNDYIIFLQRMLLEAEAEGWPHVILVCKELLEKEKQRLK